MSRKTTSTARGARDSKEKFWRGMLGRFATSGQSVRGFCRARGLSEPSFYAWRRTLKQRDVSAADGTRSMPMRHHGSVKRNAEPAPSASGPAPTFLPVLLTGSAQQPRMEIVLGGGTRIRLRGPVDRTALEQVVAVLRAAGEEG